MRIRRLKLGGFKSFVEPAELRIEPGLTGVVGPNGCGKSNLLEAIRWVMGEGSPKSLRGLPAEKTNACLANQAEVDRLVQMQNDAVSAYDIPGTPGFVLNGELVKMDNSSTVWNQLEGKIKAALGG